MFDTLRKLVLRRRLMGIGAILGAATTVYGCGPNPVGDGSTTTVPPKHYRALRASVVALDTSNVSLRNIFKGVQELLPEQLQKCPKEADVVYIPEVRVISLEKRELLFYPDWITSKSADPKHPAELLSRMGLSGNDKFDRFSFKLREERDKNKGKKETLERELSRELTASLDGGAPTGSPTELARTLHDPNAIGWILAPKVASEKGDIATFYKIPVDQVMPSWQKLREEMLKKHCDALAVDPSVDPPHEIIVWCDGCSVSVTDAGVDGGRSAPEPGATATAATTTAPAASAGKGTLPGKGGSTGGKGSGNGTPPSVKGAATQNAKIIADELAKKGVSPDSF